MDKRGCTQSDFVAAAERNRASHGHHAPPRAVKAAEVFERRRERTDDNARVLARHSFSGNAFDRTAVTVQKLQNVR